MAAPTTPRERARRRGRRLAIVVFGVIVSGATAIWTAQIIRQVWWPAYRESELGCHDGLKALIGAVARARSAASLESGDERAALARFRAALEPEWSARPGVETRCRGDSKALTALGEVDALRYAEEHAVRYEAVGLASLRRRVETIRRQLGPATSVRLPPIPSGSE